MKKFNIDFDIALSSDNITNKIENNYKFDLIITNNIYKHGCDGPTLLKILKKMHNFNTPVIINTVIRNEKDYFINICGFDGYLEKPIDQEKLEKIINKYLS